jgi:hypothetical protein
MLTKRLTLAILLLVPFFGKAQSIVDTQTCILMAHIDTLYTLCDTNYNPNFDIQIEPLANNIWQKGKTVKFGTTHARDTSCAIFTDSVNSYPVNNYSAFHFLFPKNYGQWGSTQQWNYYLKFWHKFDTDSLLDGCWLEFSDDSGMTWHKVDSLNMGFPNNYFQNGWNACNLYTNNITSVTPALVDTLLDGTKAWSGNSNGWRYTSLWINMAFPIKPSRGNGINAIRFVFKSDSINNNKQGWIIDDFAIGWTEIWGAVNDVSLFNQLPIYPNPSTNGVFNISFPSNSVNGSVQIFNINGQKIKEEALSKQVDLSNQPNGLYYYKGFFDHKVYSGVLNKQ